MKLTTTISTLMIGFLLIQGCTGSKSMAKKARKLDEAGLYAESANFYLESLRRNRKNVDAQIGLKKNGQLLLNDMLSSFFKASSMNEKAIAVDKFLEGQSYADRVKSLGVQLDIPSHYLQDFSRVKEGYLKELYAEGQKLMEKQDFSAAETVFKRIGQLDPEYKDASDLQAVAYVEPLYRSGKEALAAGHYRAAYNDLDKVVQRNATYKNARQLRDQAVEMGRYTVAVMPFTSTNNRSDIARRLMAYATTELANMNDPFIKIVDREHIDRILEEQRLNLSGVVDEQTAVNVGNLFGAQAVLIGTLMDYREEPGRLKKSTKQGFTSYKERKLNTETNETEVITRYRTATYYEYFQESKVFISMNYKLVSMETGEVLLSRVVDQTNDDQVYYAQYEGDVNDLFPSKDGKVNTSNRDIKELRSLLGADTRIKPMLELSNDLLRNTCNGMAGTVQQQIAAVAP